MRFHIQFRVLFVLLNNNILTVKSLGDRQQVFGESFKCLWGNYGEIFFLNKHVFPLQNLHHCSVYTCASQEGFLQPQAFGNQDASHGVLTTAPQSPIFLELSHVLP